MPTIKELGQKVTPQERLVVKKKDLPQEAGIDFRTVFLAGIIGAIPGVLLNAVFIDVFEASKFAITFWFLLGFGIAILHEKNTQTN